MAVAARDHADRRSGATADQQRGCGDRGHRPDPEGAVAQPGFAVHDDGPGFPPDLVDHAFERFARGDVARTRTRGGAVGVGCRGSP